MRLPSLAACALALVLALAAAAPPAHADDKAFTKAQTEQIEKIIRDYLMGHPELIVETVTKMQEREEAAQKATVRANVVKMRADLERDPKAPVLGNPNGDVTIVEFFDFRCGYCKLVYRTLLNLVKDDGKIRLVMKDFPVLGLDSFAAARAALAAHNQGKYAEFLAEGMAHRGAFDDEVLADIGKRIGLDMARYEKDQKSGDIDKQLGRIHDQARALDASGTPVFVIGDEVIPGAINEKAFKELIARARKKG